MQDLGKLAVCLSSVFSIQLTVRTLPPSVRMQRATRGSAFKPPCRCWTLAKASQELIPGRETMRKRQAGGMGHEASPQSGLGVNCKLRSSS